MTSFLSLFRQFISHHSKAADIFERRAERTIQAYEAKYRVVNLFLFESSLVHIKAEDFDIEVSANMLLWLSEVKNAKGLPRYSYNTIARIRGICREVLIFGTSNKIIKSNPLFYLVLKKLPPEKPPCLSPEQIDSFYTYYPKTIRKIKALRMAIIQLHTAFDWGDFLELKREHKINFKGQPFIVKPRHKNKIEQIIPVTEKLNEILEMHDYKICLLSISKYNIALKEIAKDLELNLELDGKMMRKIALGNKLNNEGWSLEITSKFAGHKSITTTQKYYAQPNINLVYNQLNNK